MTLLNCIYSATAKIFVPFKMRVPRLYNSSRNGRYHVAHIPINVPTVLSGIEVLPTSVVTTLTEIRFLPTVVFYFEDNIRKFRIQTTDLYHNSLEPSHFVFEIPETFYPYLPAIEAQEPDSTREE
jgi:hypothetical protein